MKLCKNSYLIKDYKMHVFYSKYLSPTVYIVITKIIVVALVDVCSVNYECKLIVVTSICRL